MLVPQLTDVMKQFLDKFKPVFNKPQHACSVKKLIKFDAEEENENFPLSTDKRIFTPFLQQGNKSINQALASFILVFLTSSIARYRPALWESILRGNTELKKDYLIQYRNALENYLMGERRFGFIINTYTMLSYIAQRGFTLINYNGSKRII